MKVTGGPTSLTFRLALLTGAWAAMGLLVVWLWVTSVVSDAEGRSFDAWLVSLADSLVAATAIRDGQPYLLRPVSEPRFDRPLSGVYYQIEAPENALLTSRSLGTALLPPGRYGHLSVLLDDVPGPRGEHLRLAERDIVMPEAEGTLHILVAASRDEAMAVDSRIRRVFAVGFILLGAGLVAAVVMQVSLGLRGLQRLQGVVSDLRAGGELSPTMSFPPEVQPLLDEIQALVRQNRTTVERARAHVGNLAHALRTRLSIMGNAVEFGDTVQLRHELIEADRLVQHHLVRARAAALYGTAAADVAVVAAAEAIGHALGILFVARNLVITVSGDSAAHVRCEREDLTEMLANLMENACKWASTMVRVTVMVQSGEVVADVSDDGQGLPEAQIRAVRERGVRVDESVPGTGLGLAITIDLAALYGGSVDMVSPGPEGGLQVRLRLPAASQRGAHPAS